MKRAPVPVLAALLCCFSAFADVRLQPSRLETAGLLAFGDFNGLVQWKPGPLTLKRNLGLRVAGAT